MKNLLAAFIDGLASAALLKRWESNNPSAASPELAAKLRSVGVTFGWLAACCLINRLWLQRVRHAMPNLYNEFFDNVSMAGFCIWGLACISFLVFSIIDCTDWRFLRACKKLHELRLTNPGSYVFDDLQKLAHERMVEAALNVLKSERDHGKIHAIPDCARAAFKEIHGAMMKFNGLVEQNWDRYFAEAEQKLKVEVGSEVPTNTLPSEAVCSIDAP